MAISDKTRKLLWGRSGNLCAICRRGLSVENTIADTDSVVGEECHIISGKRQGPRSSLDFPAIGLNRVENLILLCRVHHKQVDDQFHTWTADVLREIKAKHEAWVSSRLEGVTDESPVRVRRVQPGPIAVAPLTSGRELFALVEQGLAFVLDHDELESEEEVELVSQFLQELHDWGDIGGDLGPADRVREGFRITQSLIELGQAGFAVIGRSPDASAA